MTISLKTWHHSMPVKLSTVAQLYETAGRNHSTPCGHDDFGRSLSEIDHSMLWTYVLSHTVILRKAGTWKLHHFKIKFGKGKIKFGKRQIKFGKRKIKFGKRQIKFGKRKIKFGKRQIKFGKRNIKFGKRQIKFGKWKIKFGKRQNKLGWNYVYTTHLQHIVSHLSITDM